MIILLIFIIIIICAIYITTGGEPEEDFNPPFIIKKYSGFNVIRDDKLPGGTKQRGLYYFIPKYVTKKIIIYAGPPQGIAQVAMGVLARHYGLTAYMFYVAPSAETPLMPLSRRAAEYGVILRYGGPYLAACQETAAKFAAEVDGQLLPFGLDDPHFKDCLTTAIQKNVNFKPKRIWLVAGSGVLLNVLYRVFPRTYFLVVQVGRKIWPDQTEPKRTKIYISPHKFIENTNKPPPYKSVVNYDAKLWEFVKKYGRSGDYVWNVAG